MNASLGYSPILTEASSDYLHEQDSLRILSVVPTIEVPTPLGSFLKQNIAEIRRVETKRLQFNEQILGSVPDTLPVAYQLEPISKRYDINGSELPALGKLLYNGASGEEVELSYARSASVIVAQKLVKKMADAFFVAGSYASPNKATPNWSNTSTATPITDIDGYKQAVEKESGYTPNTAIMTPDVFLKLKNNLEVKANFAGGYIGKENGMNGGIDEARLATALGVDRVFVTKTAWNSGATGATASNNYVVGGSFFLLAYLNGNSVLGNKVENTLGVGFYQSMELLTGNRIDSGYSNGLNVSIPFPIGVRKTYDAGRAGFGQDSIIAEAVASYQLVYPEFGHLSTVTV